MLSICICTYNPKPALFSRVLEAIAAQTNAGFDVLIVDNASTPALDAALLAPLSARGIAAHIVREETPGLIHARLCAIAATASEWILCVDDDNILAPEYVAEGLAFIAAHPEVAAFGGKLALPAQTRVPEGVAPFLPYLAVRDAGEAVMKGVSEKWEAWEPPAAGAFIARPVLEDFAAFVRANANATALGRAPGSFASCEDSLLMHSAFRVGRATAYNPRLRLEHHVDPARFAFSNLVRLMEGYGRSHAVLENLLRGPAPTPHYYRTPAHAAMVALATGVRDFKHSARYAYARARYHLAAARAYRDLEKSAP